MVAITDSVQILVSSLGFLDLDHGIYSGDPLMRMSFQEVQSTNQSSNPLLRFWTDTRLCNAAARSDDAPVEPWARSEDDYFRMQATIFSVIASGCGRRHEKPCGSDGKSISARHVPSAGALYPYDVHVVLVGQDRPTLFLLDVERSGMIAQGSPSLASIGRAIRFPASMQEDLAAVVVVSARPWQSMKKYGDRGYCYACLDVAHAAVGIAGAAEGHGLDVSVFMRIARKKLAAVMGLDGSCLEPQVAIAITWKGAEFSGPSRPLTQLVVAEPADQLTKISVVKADSYEKRAWNRLRGTMPYHEDYPPPAQTAHFSSLLRHPGSAGQLQDNTEWQARQSGAWRELIEKAQQRRSARGFLAGGVTAAQAQELMSGLDATLNMDCVDRDRPVGVSLSMLTNDISGMRNGTYRLSETRTLELVQASSAPPLFQDACMNQEVVRHASGLIVLHAPILDILLDLDRASFAELHFHAGHIAHKLYLSAVRCGLGITSIGGFDEKILNSALCSGSGEGVVYALAFGRSDESARKLDREKIAYAHGDTETPEDMPSANPQ